MTPRADSVDLTRWKWEPAVPFSIFQITIKFSSEACMLREPLPLWQQQDRWRWLGVHWGNAVMLRKLINLMEPFSDNARHEVLV